MLKGQAVTQRDLNRLQERVTGTSRNLTRTTTKSCTREGIAPFSGKGWGLPGWGQFFIKGPGGLGFQQAEHGPAAGPSSREGHQHPGMFEQEHSQQVTGKDFPRLLSIC